MRLTEREQHIYALVVSGLTNQEIAERLAISNQTVRHHVSHIFEKKGVSRRIELIHLDIKLGGLKQD